MPIIGKTDDLILMWYQRDWFQLERLFVVQNFSGPQPESGNSGPNHSPLRDVSPIVRAQYEKTPLKRGHGKSRRARLLFSRPGVYERYAGCHPTATLINLAERNKW
jgi:hypothetical protein